MESLVGKVYAEALFELSCAQQTEKIVHEELEQIKIILNKNPGFLPLLTNPSISIDEKIAIIDNVFAKDLSETTLNFIKLLCQKRRIYWIVAVQTEFEKMYNEKYDIVSVIVKTAIPLKETLLEKLKLKLEQVMSKSVHVETAVDANILGGIVLEYANYTVTSTVRDKLDDIKANLLTARV